MTNKPAWFKGVVIGGLIDTPKNYEMPLQNQSTNQNLLEWYFESDGAWVEKVPLENVPVGQSPLISVSIRPGFNIEDVVIALTQVIYDIQECQL